MGCEKIQAISNIKSSVEVRMTLNPIVLYYGGVGSYEIFITFHIFPFVPEDGTICTVHNLLPNNFYVGEDHHRHKTESAYNS